MPPYQYSDIKNIVNSRIFNKVGMMVDPFATFNAAITELTSQIDLRSMKRSVPLAPNLFTDFYDYTCPIDQKGIKGIDIQTQMNDRSKNQEWNLCSEPFFDQYKQIYAGLVTFKDRSFIRVLRIAAGQVNDVSIDLSSLDSLSAGGGTWTVVGGATNLVPDSFNFIKGSASLKFDISAVAGQLTAGIQNTNLNVIDLTPYYQNGSAFIFHYITDITGISSYTLRLGTDSSNYYQVIVTQTNEGTAFYNGWNTFRFDFTSATVVGSPTLTNTKFSYIVMNKLTSKVSSFSYRFDGLQLKLGFIYNYVYYSKYPWQSLTGSWKPRATASTDYINADEDEYNLIIEKCTQKAAMEVKEIGVAQDSANNYKELSANYTKNFPSDSMTQTDDYYEFASVDGDDLNYGHSL